MYRTSAEGAEAPSALSDQVRDGALAAVLHLPSANGAATVRSAAEGLRAALPAVPGSSRAETGLLGEWPDRISRS